MSPPVPTPAPTVPPPTGNALPTCAYMDVTTQHQATGDWPITRVDTIYRLPGRARAARSRRQRHGGVNGGYLLRDFVADALREIPARAA